MQGLLNPYQVSAFPGRRDVARSVRVAATALCGAAVAAGCGSGADSEAPAKPPAPTAPAVAPTLPLPTPTPSATPAPPAPAAAEAPAGDPSAKPEVRLTKPGADYTVVRGDTLSGLALRFGVPGGWPALFERNADVLWNPDLILVGQQLDIDGAP